MGHPVPQEVRAAYDAARDSVVKAHGEHARRSLDGYCLEMSAALHDHLKRAGFTPSVHRYELPRGSGGHWTVSTKEHGEFDPTIGHWSRNPRFAGSETSWAQGASRDYSALHVVRRGSPHKRWKKETIPVEHLHQSVGGPYESRAGQLILAALHEVRVREVKPVYHVGNLDKPGKADSSNLEGQGLSVSHYPDSWRKIARGKKGMGGPTWSLHKPDANFYVVSSGAHENRAVKWAEKHGHIVPTKKFQTSRYDDEFEQEFVTHHDSMDAALDSGEADAPDEVEVVDGHDIANKKLHKKLGGNDPRAFATLAYAHHHGHDGVLWQDKHDTSTLSAPRGTIFQDKLAGFTKKKDDEPDYKNSKEAWREEYESRADWLIKDVLDVRAWPMTPQ